ncbi:MAG TPA: hypothetical protein VJO33_05290, partial [Gemmatimonadaceae bacterium]|nr:hypothetical protein [Gemmatimonadaceae bacterium]
MFGVRRSRKAILLLLLAACRDALSPFPNDARPLVPTPIQYATWWRMTEACARRSGDFNAIRWYNVLGDVIRVDGEDYI